MKIKNNNKYERIVLRMESSLYKKISDLSKESGVTKPEVIRQCLDSILMNKKVSKKNDEMVDCENS